MLKALAKIRTTILTNKGNRIASKGRRDSQSKKPIRRKTKELQIKEKKDRNLSM